VRLTLIGLLALAMGGQNAVVRRLAVPDLTTTVLTLTVTGLVADTTSQSVRRRRLISVLAMLGGALMGGVLLRWVASPRRSGWRQYCWSPALQAPTRRPAAPIPHLAVARGAPPAANEGVGKIGPGSRQLPVCRSTS
jgi:hypothetical protein